MTSSEQPVPSPRNIQRASGKLRNRKGVALILVVAFIVLMSALVVGFFSRVSTDLAGARSYAEGVSARQLAESAVSVVMGQIQAATTITNGCWASQPGMIRVYGGANGQAGSQAYRFYKLYSSHNMVLTDFSQFNPASTDPGAGANTEVPVGQGGWQNQPAFFTDLNAPVAVPDPQNPAATVNRFPIFDPAVATVNNVAPVNSVEGCAMTYPDTGTLATNPAPMPVRWIYVLRDGTLTAPTPLDGTAAGTSGLQAIWSNPPTGPSSVAPSSTNPIVGRIAFWADDDTCKVNINTAGGYVANEPANPNYAVPSGTFPETNPAFIAGSFWDTPRVQTYFDRGVSGYPVAMGLTPAFRGGLASSQPVRNEFQRYPGHPATTSLGLVLKGLLPPNSGLTSEKLYDLSPRLMSGVWKPGETYPPNALARNSEGGSQQLVAYGQVINPGTGSPDADPPSSIKRTFDPTVTYSASTQATWPGTIWSCHLLSSVDELYYTTLNTPTVSNPAGGRTTTNAQSGLNNAFTPTIIDQARFFLTAHSHSSDLNLFGRPRVCVWPIPSLKSQGPLLSTMDVSVTPPRQGIRNPSDDLLQFCSTVGASPLDPVNDPQGLIRKGQFIFDREDPLSSVNDFRRTRNQQIFSYLHQVTSNSPSGNIPGWGQSFAAKYSGGTGGSDQILTEIFDYIRTVNLKDTSRDQRIDLAFGRDASKVTVVPNPLPPPAPSKVYQAPPKVPAAETLKLYARYSPRGVVVPTRDTVNGNQVAGFGRFPTISEISLVLYHGGYICKPKPTAAAPSPAEFVEYNFDLVNEANYNKKAATTTWFQNNDITGQLVRAFLIVETFDPMQGYGPVTQFNSGTNAKERIVYEIESMTGFTIQVGNQAPQPLNIGGRTGNLAALFPLTNNVFNVSGDTWGGRNFGGTEGFFHTLLNKTGNTPYPPGTAPFPWANGAVTYQPYGGATGGGRSAVTGTFQTTNGGLDYYPFQSPCQQPMDGVRIPYPGVKQGATGPNSAPQAPPLLTQTLNFSGGTVNMQVRYTDVAHTAPPSAAHNQIIQNFTFTFPPGTNWPIPITEKDATIAGQGFRADLGGFNFLLAGFDSNSANTVADFNGGKYSWADNGGYRMPFHLPLRILWSQQQSYSPWTKLNPAGTQVGNGLHYANRYLQILQPGDVIRSLQPGSKTLYQCTDPRTAGIQLNVGTGQSVGFQPHPDYYNTAATVDINISRRAQTLRTASGAFYFDPTNAVWFPGQLNAPTTGMLIPNMLGNVRYISNASPDLPKTVIAKQATGIAADFDTGIGNFPDGGFCGKADEGNVARSWEDQWGNWYFVEPYFSTWIYDSPGDTYFSPNRQIPSPVAFGSLLAPTTSLDKAGWKTLLFCPNPAAGLKTPTRPYSPGTDHPGFANPPDHLLLDLFNMPVVEPYAISEPFSTDGRVNLNYQLMPFGYIQRSTALRAALQSLRITAIPNNLTRQNGGATEVSYKGVNNNQNLRYFVNRDETIKGFDYFYSQYAANPNLGFFKSASQICEMPLYPKGQPYNYGTVTFSPGDAQLASWWGTCGLTGDNVREKPYSDLYPRVTTKSNTYTVHYRVQSLRQRPYSGDPSNTAAMNAYYQMWDESRDKVLSEYRGHTTIERYIDPRDPRFYGTGTNAINPDTQSLETAYRFRVIFNKRFSPW